MIKHIKTGKAHTWKASYSHKAKTNILIISPQERKTSTKKEILEKTLFFASSLVLFEDIKKPFGKPKLILLKKKMKTNWAKKK